MLLLNQKMTPTQAWEKGFVMEVFKPDNFLEQVDNRVKAMAAMSNKVNTQVICHIKWNQWADDLAFIFNYFQEFYIVSRWYPLHPLPGFKISFIIWVPSDDWILFSSLWNLNM